MKTTVLACMLFILASIIAQNFNWDITPQEWYENIINSAGLKEHPRGESFCWYARVGMERPLHYYEVTKNTEWLDAAVKYYDFLLGKMDTAPDGYKGWIGPYGYDKKYWCDVHVGDALLFNGMLDFVLLVEGDPALKEKYRNKSHEYVQATRTHFVEKWDARGTWREDGQFGVYVQDEKFLKPGIFDKWVDDREANRANLSHPFNKQNDAAQVCMRLYQLTGDKFFRDRAMKIFYFMKSRFQFHDNHYVWNYWEPFGPFDIDLVKKRTRHWVGIHPYRSGYTAREVEQVVDAYHTGIVFNETDIQRIINTNLEVMWNKDLENPDFISPNGLGKEKDTTGIGAFRAVYGHSNVRKYTGQLWTSLIDFNQTIRDLYERRIRNRDSFQWYYYKNFIASKPPDFTRKHVKDGVFVEDFDFTDSADLYCVAALPHIFRKGEDCILVAMSMNSGNLEIAVYSDKGKELVLYEGDIKGFKDIGGDALIIMWNGIDATGKKSFNGSYRIRWTIGNGYREFPITIK